MKFGSIFANTVIEEMSKSVHANIELHVRPKFDDEE
jgi:hypothetical protein